MNRAEKLAAVFEGEWVDAVPFALKGWRIPSCELERQLLDDGLCILDSAQVYGTASPNVESETLQLSVP